MFRQLQSGATVLVQQLSGIKNVSRAQQALQLSFQLNLDIIYYQLDRILSGIFYSLAHIIGRGHIRRDGEIEAWQDGVRGEWPR